VCIIVSRHLNDTTPDLRIKLEEQKRRYTLMDFVLLVSENQNAEMM